MHKLEDEHYDHKLGTSSSYALQLARNWLKICETNHHSGSADGCPLVEEHELPTRVIDVGDGGARVPVLIEGKGKRARYCTLSYCWGGISNVTTTSSTIHAHSQGIPLAAAPATVRDAIVAAQSLGFRYIWIDSLCIIQDDPQDWMREAEKMADIY